MNIKTKEGIPEDFQKDSVVFGPPSLDKWMEKIKMENGKLLQKLQEFLKQRRVSKFGLERFSNSNEEIKFYAGFPDYVT